MNPVRRQVLEKVAQRILLLRLEHPVRVGIDGITASGKSTFARELSEILKAADRTVIHTTLDGFHNPRSRRYALGRDSAEGYYYDAYNYGEIIENLLLPLGSNGSLRFRTKIFDLEADRPIQIEAASAHRDDILIVDGSFALRPELRDHWDFRIFLSVPFDLAVDRAGERDAKLFGSSEEARRVTKSRYHGAHRIHVESCKPQEAATVVIQNEDPHNPKILIGCTD